MLPARHRMRRSSDFDASVRGGRRAGRRSLVVHLGLAADGSQPARIGLVVSRAVGSAVVRNRVSRRLRHLARERVGALPAGALVVLRANPPAAQASAHDLGADLDGALRRLLGSYTGPGDEQRPALVGQSGNTSARGGMR
jgi:ribonuclease P protein component